VERVGEAVREVRRGDHVVLSFQSCGHCPACRGRHPTDCESLYDMNFGFHRPDGSNALRRSFVRGHFFGQSSFATHVLATERNLVKVPKHLPLEILAPLGCGMQTGAGTVMNSLNVPAGASIAVFGNGRRRPCGGHGGANRRGPPHHRRRQGLLGGSSLRWSWVQPT